MVQHVVHVYVLVVLLQNEPEENSLFTIWTLLHKSNDLLEHYFFNANPSLNCQFITLEDA
jgi:hypothetical protein